MSKGPRIASSLVENSIEAMYCAIELHNKPILKYRYETCAILIINAWELIMKAYMYKIIKDKDIIKYLKTSLRQQSNNLPSRISEDINMKSSVSVLIDKVFVGRENMAIAENLKFINKLRNDFIHAYIEELNPILYALMCKSIIECQKFLKLHFSKDLSAHSDLVLLPIGFSKPINITDYLSNGEGVRTSKLAKEIFDITAHLEKEGINESILVNFHISMNTANNVSNPDLLVSIGSSGSNIIKTTKIKFDPKGQPTGNISIGELEKVFTIPAKSLMSKMKGKDGLKIQTKVWQNIHKKYRNDKFHAIYWWRNRNTMRLYWSEGGFDKLSEEYLQSITL